MCLTRSRTMASHATERAALLCSQVTGRCDHNRDRRTCRLSRSGARPDPVVHGTTLWTAIGPAACSNCTCVHGHPEKFPRPRLASSCRRSAELPRKHQCRRPRRRRGAAARQVGGRRGPVADLDEIADPEGQRRVHHAQHHAQHHGEAVLPAAERGVKVQHYCL